MEQLVLDKKEEGTVALEGTKPTTTTTTTLVWNEAEILIQILNVVKFIRYYIECGHIELSPRLQV